MSQNKLIKVNTHELSSLKAAILKFKSQMSEIYKIGELIGKVGGFISHEGKLFQNSDLADKEQIKAISKFGSINAPSYAKLENLSELQYEQLNRDDVYLSFSHIVVFQNALEYPELKDLVLEFCRELIEYSIEVDSSNELSFSTDSYFGIYILVLLVEKYPEFAYMIGEFISKNSDYNQIKYHCAPYVTYLFDKYRYGQIFIDIFTNCRFQELYIAMGEDYYDEMERFSPNILKYFLEDEKNIETYKQALFESLKRRPIEPKEINLHRILDDNHDSLLYTVYEDADTGEFDYNQMQKDGIEEEFDDMKLCGVDIEEFIQNLKEEMNEVLRDVLLKDMYYYSSPVYSDTTTFGDTLDDVFYQEYDEENEYETNKEFFLEGFENGEDILAYIEDGKNPDILNSLKPTLLRKLAFEKKLYIYKRFEYYGKGGFSFGTDLEQDVSLEDILEKFIAPYYSPDSFYIQNDGEAAQIEKCLRCVDVLMRILGKKELNSDEINILTDDFELCYKKEARQRFSIQALDTDELKESIYELMNDPFCDSLGLDKLDEIHEYYKKDPKLFGSILDDIIEVSYESIDEDILAVVPSLNQNEYAKGAQLIPVAYILYKESNSFIKSKDLDPLWKFYTNNIFKTFHRELAETYSDKLSFKDEKYEKKAIYLEKIKEYLESQEEKSSSGFFAKFMKKEETNKEKISKEEALNYAKELLAVDTTEEIVHSSLFSSDNIPMILASMLYVAKVAPTPLKKKLISAYELILELFPSKTLLVSFYEFRENGEFLSDATSEEIESFYDYLVDIGFDEKYSFILKILIIQKLNNYKNSIELFDNEYGLRDMYANLLETYRAKDKIDEDEPAMFRRRQEQINKAIGEAVELLDINHKNKFLEFVYRGFDDEKLLAIIKDRAKAEIQELIKVNTQINDENKRQELSKMLFTYIFEDMSIDGVEENLVPLFTKMKSLSRIDDLSALLVKCDDKIVLKLLKFLCKIDRVKNLDYFYEQFTGGYNKNTEHKATKKLVQMVKNDGFESEVLFEFYLKQFKHNDNYFDFKDNPFSQVLMDEFENIKKYEALANKKAYKLFEELQLKYTVLKEAKYIKSQRLDDE